MHAKAHGEISFSDSPLKNRSSVPCVLPFGSGGDVTGIRAGDDWSFAITKNGTLIGWGNNIHGQLGTPPEAGIDPELALKVPNLPPKAEILPVIVQVKDSEGRSAQVRDVQCGKGHSLALLRDGSVLSCGYNVYKQLGLGQFSGQDQFGFVSVGALAKEVVRNVTAQRYKSASKNANVFPGAIESSLGLN
jgi:alpha-tubulin suppressor-like RCC1 family protein